MNLIKFCEPIMIVSLDSYSIKCRHFHVLGFVSVHAENDPGRSPSMTGWWFEAI